MERRAQLSSLDYTPREGRLQLITLISKEPNRGWGKNQLGCILAGWHLGEGRDSFEIWGRSCWQQLVPVNPFCSKLQRWRRRGALPAGAPGPSLGRSVLELMCPHSS